jgi:hypothetical protein
MAAGLPSWAGLLKAIITECGTPTPAALLPGNSGPIDFDRVQFDITKKAGKLCSCRVMHQQLCGHPLTEEMENRLTALAALPVAAIITWNWDDLLERHGGYKLSEHEWGQDFGEDIINSRKGSLDSPRLLKLQGSTDKASNCVVTEEDYAKIQPTRDRFLKRLYTEGEWVVLHIGQGVDKFINAEGVIGPAFSQLACDKPNHYAIVPDATAKQKKEALVRGVQLVSYDSKQGHTVVLCSALMALSTLAAQVKYK